jgi:hypothetical protein
MAESKARATTRLTAVIGGGGCVATADGASETPIADASAEAAAAKLLVATIPTRAERDPDFEFDLGVARWRGADGNAEERR